MSVSDSDYGRTLRRTEDQYMKRLFSIFGRLAGPFTALVCCLGATHVTNSTGKPLSLWSVNDSQGNKTAEFWLTGKDLVVDDNHHIVEGAGYIQAVKAESYPIQILISPSAEHKDDLYSNILRLDVTRIEWDNDGNTIAVEGVNPHIHAAIGEGFKIVSKTYKLPIVNGEAEIEIEGKGKFSLPIKFGSNSISLKNADALLTPRAGQSATQPTTKP
jgi:hypothetical protein